jgi:enoyl-CoA hydratase
MNTIVSYSEADGIATIAMDDGKANALSTTMIEQLDAAIDRAEADARALVLVGRPGRFSAGFDLREMMSGPAGAVALVKKGGQLMMRLYGFKLPVVVACSGHAIAGGALLVATGDTRIGALGPFKIGLNEVGNGMPVPVFGHELARDRLLPTALFAAVVQSEIQDPEGAVRVGWLDRAVGADELLAEAVAEATRLSRLPKGAYAVTKRSLRRGTIQHVLDTLDANLAALLPG